MHVHVLLDVKELSPNMAQTVGPGIAGGPNISGEERFGMFMGMMFWCSLSQWVDSCACCILVSVCRCVDVVPLG